MDLGDTGSILVIILSVMLAIFLLLSIVVMILVVKVVRHIKRIIEKAEAIADKAESVTSFFQHTTGPAAIGKLVSNILHASREFKERTKK